MFKNIKIGWKLNNFKPRQQPTKPTSVTNIPQTRDSNSRHFAQALKLQPLWMKPPMSVIVTPPPPAFRTTQRRHYSSRFDFLKMSQDYYKNYDEAKKNKYLLSLLLLFLALALYLLLKDREDNFAKELTTAINLLAKGDERGAELFKSLQTNYPIIKQITKLIENGEYQKASETIEKLTESYPQLKPLHFNLKACVMHKDGIKENSLYAIELLNYAITLDPDFLMTYITKGQLLYDIGDYQNAILSLDTAIKSGAKGNILFIYYALSHKELTQYQEALSYCDLILQSDFNAHTNALNFTELLLDTQKAPSLTKVDILELKAGLLYNQHQFDSAIINYQAALVLSPESSQLHLKLGRVFFQTDQMDLALKSYQEALRLGSPDLSCYAEMGTILYLSGKKQQALDCYNRIIATQPENPQWLADRAIIEQSLGNKEGAKKDFQRAMECAAKQPDFKYTDISLLNNQKNTKAVQDSPIFNATVGLTNGLMLITAVSLTFFGPLVLLPIIPASILNLISMTPISSALSSIFGGFFVIQKSNEVQKNLYLESRKYSLQGIQFSNQKQYESAINEFNIAIALDPNFYEAYHQRAKVYVLLGKMGDALRDLDNAIKLDQKNATLWHEKGILLSKIGESDQALSCFVQANSLNPTEAEFRLNKELILSYFSPQRRQSVIKQLDKAPVSDDNKEKIKDALKELDEIEQFEANIWKNEREEYHTTPLHELLNIDGDITSYDLQELRKFINQPDQHGETPLMIATKRGNDFAVEYLINMKADINQVTLDLSLPEVTNTSTLKRKTAITIGFEKLRNIFHDEKLRNIHTNILCILLRERPSVDLTQLHNTLNTHRYDFKGDADHSQQDNAILDYVTSNLGGLVEDDARQIRLLPGVATKYWGHLHNMPGALGHDLKVTPWKGLFFKELLIVNTDNAELLKQFNLEGWNIGPFLTLRTRSFIKMLYMLNKKSTVMQNNFPKTISLHHIEKSIKNEVLLSLELLQLDCALTQIYQIFAPTNNKKIRHEVTEKLISALAENVRNKVTHLKPAEIYQIFAGYNGHALYMDFTRDTHNNRIVPIIDNAGELSHPHWKKNGSIHSCAMSKFLIEATARNDSLHKYLVEIFFAKMTDYNVNQFDYYDAIVHSEKTLNKEQFSKIIYREECESAQNKTEPQRISNCVAYNHNMALARRIGNPLFKHILAFETAEADNLIRLTVKLPFYEAEALTSEQGITTISSTPDPNVSTTPTPSRP